MSERFGKPIHGVLGHSLLSGRIVQIDYPNRILRFYSERPFPKQNTEANTALGLEAEVSRAQPSTSVGYNNASENTQGKVEKVTVGGISVESPVVLFFGKGTGRDKKPWGLNIGNEFSKISS